MESEEAVVGAMLFHQLFVGALLGNDPVFQDEDLVGDFDGVETVGDEDNGFVGGDGEDFIKDFFFGFGIDITRRFVEDHNGRVPVESTGESDALPLSLAWLDAVFEFFVERIVVT